MGPAKLKKYGNLLTTESIRSRSLATPRGTSACTRSTTSSESWPRPGSRISSGPEANEISGARPCSPAAREPMPRRTCRSRAVPTAGLVLPGHHAVKWLESLSVRPEVQQAITVIDGEALAMQDIWLADEIPVSPPRQATTARIRSRSTATVRQRAELRDSHEQHGRESGLATCTAGTAGRRDGNRDQSHARRRYCAA